MLNFETRHITGNWIQTAKGKAFFPDKLSADELEHVTNELHLWVDNDGAFYNATIMPCVESVVTSRRRFPETRIDPSLFSPQVEKQIAKLGFRLEGFDHHSVVSCVSEQMAKYYNDEIDLGNYT